MNQPSSTSDHPTGGLCNIGSVRYIMEFIGELLNEW